MDQLVGLRKLAKLYRGCVKRIPGTFSGFNFNFFSYSVFFSVLNEALLQFTEL